MRAALLSLSFHLELQWILGELKLACKQQFVGIFQAVLHRSPPACALPACCAKQFPMSVLQAVVKKSMTLTWTGGTYLAAPLESSNQSLSSDDQDISLASRYIIDSMQGFCLQRQAGLKLACLARPRMTLLQSTSCSTKIKIDKSIVGSSSKEPASEENSSHTNFGEFQRGPTKGKGNPR